MVKNITKSIWGTAFVTDQFCFNTVYRMVDEKCEQLIAVAKFFALD
jgi:hypothetical protein